MKRKFRIMAVFVVVIVLIAASGISVGACAPDTEKCACYEYYTDHNGFVYLHRYIGDETVTHIDVPITLGGNMVVEIEEYAFDLVHGLETVTLPNSITKIGTSAFAGTALREVMFPVDLGSIGSDAFSGCTSLTDVTLYGTLDTIYADAFDGCTALTDVYYYGTQAQWNALVANVRKGNDALLNATVHFMSLPSVRGDVDGNGALTVWDAMIVYRAAANGGVNILENRPAYDIDGDGRFTMRDALKLYHAVAGKEILE